MQTLSKNEPWCKAVIPGVILWRPVAFSSVSARIEESCRPMHCSTVFQPASDGGFIARLAMPGCFISDPELIPPQTKQGKPRRGLVVFVKEMPADNWTHLVATETTKHLQTNGCGEHGGAVYAEVGRPYSISDYVDFRVRMLKAIAQTADMTDFDAMADVMSEIWPAEEREDSLRLMIRPAPEGGDVSWHFDFAEDGSEADATAHIEAVDSAYA